MRATLYKNNMKEVVICVFNSNNFDDAVSQILERFPKATLLVDGNKFKWLSMSESRILISND
ncbi:hypothetical protein VA249_45790 (plasmid) [Vibrio alfacsensis]|nr:hypothetical protein VA249_45790 [Vibrio alfacsensis]